MQKLYIVIKYIMVIRHLWQKERMTLNCWRNYVGISTNTNNKLIFINNKI